MDGGGVRRRGNPSIGSVPLRTARPLPAAAGGTYDRTQGRVSPPPAGGEAGRTAAADASTDEDEPYEERRRAFKRSKAAHWSEGYPLRMRRWIQHSMHDIATRIYTEVVVRLPMTKVGKDEVMGLVQPYGDVEYVASLDKAAKVRVPPGAASGLEVDSSSDGSGIDMGHAHIVRFKEGLDAVRCFLELNGAVIDPSRYNAAIDSVNAVLQQDEFQLDNDSGDTSAQEALDRARSDLMSKLSVANATKGSAPTDLIFVTVEFFRLAFAEGAADGGVTARSTLPVAAAKGPRFAIKPTGETPIAWLARRLAQHAAEASHWFPIVSSHRPITWEQFCNAVNLTAFMLSTPTANAFYAATLPANIDPRRQDEVRGRMWEPSHWSVAAEALGRAAYDPDDLMRLVDVSTTPVELMRGVKHRPTLRGRLMQQAHDWLDESPLLVGLFLLLVTSVLVAITIFLTLHHTTK